MKSCLSIVLLIFSLLVFQTPQVFSEWEGPDFLILGGAKCGTGSLYKYIKFHPHSIVGKHKEIHFYDREENYRQGEGLGWYEDQFPLKTSPEQKVFEATPIYIYHPLSPERVYRHFPNTKLIILLRNPVDRAYSHFKMRKKIGCERRPGSFREIIESEYITFEEELNNPVYNWRRYLLQGVYLNQIKRWQKYFPNDQILILLTSDLSEYPGETANRVFQFVGLEEHYLSSYYRCNTGDPNDQLDSETRELLEDIYRPYNEELNRYLLDEFNVEIDF